MKPYMTSYTTAVLSDSASSMRLSQDKIQKYWDEHVECEEPTDDIGGDGQELSKSQL